MACMYGEVDLMGQSELYAMLYITHIRVPLEDYDIIQLQAIEWITINTWTQPAQDMSAIHAAQMELARGM